MTRKGLTPSEALEFVHLEHSLDKTRTLVLEFLLCNASFAKDLSAKNAWWSLYALLAFVEARKRFPYKEELYPYLSSFLSKGVMPELPPFSLVDLQEYKEMAVQLEIALRSYAKN